MYVADRVRGVTANPAIFARAIKGSSAYDEQFSALIGAGPSVADTCWELVFDDINSALGLLRPVYAESGGGDGFASIEGAPEIALDTAATVAAARGAA
jgi:transaldolase